MKKIYVALGILVVLAAAFIGYYQYLKSSLLADLDGQYLPAAEQMLKEQTGREWDITYEQAKADGFDLLVTGLAFTPKDAPEGASTVAQLTLSFDVMSLMTGDQSLDLLAEDILLPLDPMTAKIEKVETSQLKMEAGQSLSFKQLKVGKTILESDEAENKSVEISSVRVDKCRAVIHSEEKYYLLDLAGGEMVIEEQWTISFEDFSTKSMFSGVIFPPPGSYFAKLKEISLKKQDQDFISAHELNTTSEVTEGRIDSISELKQFIVKPVEISGSNALKEWFEEMGYEEFKMAVSGKASMVKEGDVIDMPEMVITMAEAGQLTFSARMLGFLAFLTEYQAADEAQKEAMKDLADQLQLAQFGIKYEDHSLIDRIARLLTKGGKDMKPEQLRLQWAKVMQIFALQATNDKLRSLYQALAVFLQDPKNIKIEMQPSEPVAFTKLVEEGWPGILDTLNLKARANMDE